MFRTACYVLLLEDHGGIRNKLVHYLGLKSEQHSAMEMRVLLVWDSNLPVLHASRHYAARNEKSSISEHYAPRRSITT